MVLEWARENGCPWDEDTCGGGGAAISIHCSGARERLPVGREDVRFAAYGGHLEVLKWARENGCPWDEDTCARAAGAAISNRLQWARERLPVGRVDARRAAWTATLRC